MSKDENDFSNLNMELLQVVQSFALIVNLKVSEWSLGAYRILVIMSKYGAAFLEPIVKTLGLDGQIQYAIVSDDSEVNTGKIKYNNYNV